MSWLLLPLGVMAVMATFAIAYRVNRGWRPGVLDPGGYDRTRSIRRRLLPLALRKRLVCAYDRRFRRDGHHHQGASS